MGYDELSVIFLIGFGIEEIIIFMNMLSLCLSLRFDKDHQIEDNGYDAIKCDQSTDEDLRSIRTFLVHKGDLD